MSHKLEQFKFKLEKIIGIYKHAGKVRKFLSFSVPLTEHSSIRIPLLLSINGRSFQEFP